MTATRTRGLKVLAALALSLSAAPAFAQPTQAQRDAIRSNCRSDFMSNCSSVTPGGAEALQCLQRNMSKLAPACQSAVNAISPPPAAPPAPKPAAAAPAPEPAPAPAAAPAPAPASTPAATTTAAAPATQPAPTPRAPAAAPARTAAVPPPAAAPAARPASAPTQAQRDAIRAACQSDFMAKCRGVQPGGAEAFQCLQRNSSQLAPACRSAVAAIGGGTPAAAAPAASAAPAAAAAAPAAMPTPAQQNAIKMSCRGDFRANCRGVQTGGQEAFMCLQRNAAKLSPDCKTAMTAALEGDPSGAAPAATAAAAPAARPGGLPPGPFPVRRAIRERLMGGQ